MDKYGYTLKQNIETNSKDDRYHKESLELMTTFQLQEICRKERIIQGMINPMDKDELIHVILRYRGADEYYLIRNADKQDLETLEHIMKQTTLSENQDIYLTCSSKIVSHEGLAIGFYDKLTLPYDKKIAGTNALIVGGDGKICTILNVEAKGNDTKYLYLTKAAEIAAVESAVKNYSLYCMSHRSSEILYKAYTGSSPYLPERLEVYRIPLLDFEVRSPVALTMPLAMDFGTTNTTAGVYLDNQYFEEAGILSSVEGLQENHVNYTKFYDVNADWQETTLLPSVVSVLSVGQGENRFLFGYEAVELAGSSYVDEGFCVFYDIKRWIGDYEKVEEITDREGHREFIKRKEILKAYFDYVIHESANQFKCLIHSVHISCPVKQKSQFIKLFKEILPDYAIEENEMIDEGVSVLYNTISGLIQSDNVRFGEEYKALVIDCGGGTTDLCSCAFRINDRRVAYQIEISTSYENGDTDFGGNNLTFRIMQLLKIAIVDRLNNNEGKTVQEILSAFDTDVYRYVDEYGSEQLYQELDIKYAEMEQFFPTRFKEYEQKSRTDYFKVKNNFYFLFHLAESIKKEFYNRTGTLRIALSSLPIIESATTWIPVDKWKLSIYQEEKLHTMKDFPAIYFNIYEMELLLKADIYGVIQRFMESMYEEGKVEEYSIIKLTGQSCKIDTFRSALKEFVPGKTIQFKRRSGDRTKDYELKMTCVDGALRYLKDKKYGFADIVVHTEEPALPYRIVAYTHSGQEVVLIHRLKRGKKSGMISRNMEELTLKLYLVDLESRERYQYTCYSSLTDFTEVQYEDIHEKYGEHIRQADTDDIVEREVKFFIWSKAANWSFVVVPVYRKEESLYLGKEEEFYYENDNWVQSFFDGLK